MTEQIVQYFHMTRESYIQKDGDISVTGWKYLHGPMFNKTTAFDRLPDDVDWSDGGKSEYKVMENIIEVKESVNDS